MRLPTEFRRRYEPIAPDGFFEALTAGLPKTIRFNTLKADRPSLLARAKQQGWELTPLPWFTDGFIIDREDRTHPLGHSLEHFAGHIYIQEASSMVPPLVLDPRPEERVLDLAAAPGSKTTQLAAMMENQGLLVANDSSAPRLRALTANLERVGTLNTVITQLNGARLGRFAAGYFDKVLLDAPCTAEGTIAKSDEALRRWSEQAIRKLATLQAKLLIGAYQALRPGGVLVYSTCTFAPEENELVIDDFLMNHPEVELLDFDLPGLSVSPGLTKWQGRALRPELTRAQRIWPGAERMEGFFIAKLKKPDGFEKAEAPRTFPDRRYGDVDDEVTVWLREHFGFTASWPVPWLFRSKDSERWLMSREAAHFRHLPIIRRGLRAARVVTNGFKPTTGLCQLFGQQMSKNIVQVDAAEAQQYLRGEDLSIEAKRGYVTLVHDGIPFACGLSQGDPSAPQRPGRIKNQVQVSRRVRERVY